MNDNTNATETTTTPKVDNTYYVAFSYTGPQICRLTITGPSPEAVQEEISKSLRKDVTNVVFDEIRLIEDPDTFDPDSIPAPQLPNAPTIN